MAYFLLEFQALAFVLIL
jgi:hypothetical protein